MKRYNCEKWNRRFQLVVCKAKITIIFVKTIISIRFQVQIDTSAVQNVVNAKACAHQGKRSVVARQADQDNGPFGHT